MAELMSELCEKGVELIWKQCNEALFPQGLEYLKEAAEKGGEYFLQCLITFYDSCKRMLLEFCCFINKLYIIPP